MAMPAAPAPITTIEQLLALPADGMRHELLDGLHVVTPAPEYAHQALLGEFCFALCRALEGSEVRVLTSPADIILGARTLVQPDLFVIRRPPAGSVTGWRDVGIPLLAIEFLSPTTAGRDRGAKRLAYQRAGVTEYWIVDLDARLVERWHPSDERPEILAETIVWEPGVGSARVAINLPTLFASVLGDAT